MASYKEIFGTNIEVLASDPANPVQGQVWYNSTSNVVKGQGATTVGAWATGGNMNTGREQVAGSGTKDASLAFGGYVTANVGNTESYNGASWTEVNDLNSATRSIGSFGSQTSAIAAGGNPPNAKNESWNGTSWTELADLNTARSASKGVGADNTLGLVYGGYTTTNVAVNESWNGTSWTELNDLNTARASLGGAGTATAALAFNGGPQANVGPAIYNTESWNGTSWTTLPATTNTAAEGTGSNGSQTSAIVFGGSIYAGSGPNARTELWNGSAWTETTDLSTGRSTLGSGSGGNNTSAIGFGGSGNTNATEEWTGPGSPLTVTFTDS
jgi:hypothetical protein